MQRDQAGAFQSWILESMTSGIVGIDSEGRMVALNAGAQRILGCPPEGEPEAALGRSCWEVLACQPAVARLLVDTLDRRSALSRAELVLEGGEASATIGLTLCPVRDATGRVRGAAMIFRDLAPIERGDEQERLRERLAALGQMAAGLAHEIRNPLAGMEILAGLLKRRLADRPEEEALLVELTGELRSLAETVTASLDFVRPVVPQRAPVDPVRLVEESLERAVARVPFAGEVRRSFEPDLPALQADAEQLHTLLTNLLVNAFEAMLETRAEPGRLDLTLRSREPEPGGGAVRVGPDGAALGVGAAGREVEIVVSDTGPGVSPELREKVFYPFFTTKERGSGVGLAAAQKIAASHGGSLELGGGAGRGCTFRVRLPAGPGSAA